jgi:hypothetical protein
MQPIKAKRRFVGCNAVAKPPISIWKVSTVPIRVLLA